MELVKRDDGYWWVGFTTDHGYKWRNTKAQGEPEAQEICAQAKIAELEMTAKSMRLTGDVLAAIYTGRGGGKCSQVFGDWVEWRAKTKSPITTQIQTYIVGRFLRTAGLASKPVNRIDDEVINAFVNGTMNGTKAGGASNRSAKLSAITSFVQYCSNKGYMIGNPAKQVKINYRDMKHEEKESTPRVPFTEEEYRMLVGSLDGFYRTAVALSFWAGLRIGDIAMLEWSSLLSEEIVVWTRKRNARVALPINDPLFGGGELSLFFLELTGSKKGGFVFPLQASIYSDTLKRSTLSTYFGRSLTRLGVVGKSFHCLRHSFCTRLEKAGVSEEEIGRLVGHSNVATTQGYIHRDRESPRIKRGWTMSDTPTEKTRKLNRPK